MSDSVLVPDGWVYGAIGDCVSRIGDGGTPATSNEEYYGGNIAWVVVHDITRSIKKTNSYITELGLKKSSAKLWQKNSVIISTGATIGEVGIAQIPLATKQGIAGIECNNKCLPEFLYYSLIFKKLHILSLAQGSTIKEVRTPILVKIPLLIPPLPEQKKIASILTSVDDVIEKTEAQISKLQDLKKGMMTKLLTTGIGHTEFKDSPVGRIPVEWDVKRLGDVATLQRGHDLTKTQRQAGIYPVVSSSGVTGYHSEFKTSAPAVLVGRKGSIGTVHYFTTHVWAHDTSLYVIDFHGNNEKFVYYQFLHLDLGQFGTKSGSPSLNRNDIHPIKIALPKPEEQYKISAILNNNDILIKYKKEKLSHTKSLKKALMNDLLTGKKRVI